MKRATRTLLAGGVVVLVGGAVVAAAIGIGGANPSGSPQHINLPPATAAVTRTMLTQTQTVNGTLGYGPAVPVTAGNPGKITWLPPLGATIGRGRQVYRLDNRPVPLFYGRLPLYRPLRSGDTGADVKEVEENLAALGYTGLTIDYRYTSATAAAVRKWQKDLGLTRTGTVDPAGVVVAAGVIRVASLTAHLGDPASGPVLTCTATTRTVDVALDVSLQGLVKPGVAATVTLPDSKIVKGTVAAVGTVATAGQPGRPATIGVTVTVGDQSAFGSLDQAPVVVTLVSATVKNVLTVPVAALSVLPDGGYGVQVVTGTSSHFTAVKLGMFGSGRVQVSGNGMTAGTLVGIPS